jgi:lipoic acid synthetase
VLDDLREAGVERLTIGQYLRPSPQQLTVEEFIHPDRFDELADEAWNRGFRWVISAPFARSSYHAELPSPALVSPGRPVKGMPQYE